MLKETNQLFGQKPPYLLDVKSLDMKFPELNNSKASNKAKLEARNKQNFNLVKSTHFLTLVIIITGLGETKEVLIKMKKPESHICYTSLALSLTLLLAHFFARKFSHYRQTDAGQK